jgi:CelD/BcsL family acetyltransferase involved in cellulose biosynthesis
MKMNSSSYHIESFGIKTYQALQNEWCKLFARADYAPYCLSFPWVSTFIETHQFKGRVSILTIRQNGTLLAVLPLMICRIAWLKVAKPIGTGIPGCLGILLDSAHLDVLSQLADFIICNRVFDVYVNDDLSSDDIATQQLLNELHKRGMKSHQVYRNITHYARLNGSFEDYLNQTKSPKSKKKLRWKEKKLYELGQVQIHHYRGTKLTESVLDKALEIQQQSWMVQRGAVFLANPFRRSLILAMAQADLARLWLMTINGDNAAFELAFHNNKRLEFHLRAFKLKFNIKQQSIGDMLTQQVFRDACHEQIKVINFGHSDALWKRFWGTHQHQIWRSATGSRATGRVLVGFYFAIWKIYDVKFIRRLWQRITKLIRRFYQNIS